jgi:Meiotically up-regulated gene 113
MTKQTLDDILAEEDELGLLKVKPSTSGIVTEASRILQGFEEISTFVDKHGFAPGEGASERKASVAERALQMRLKAYRGKPEIISDLKPFDRHGLLNILIEPPTTPMTLEEILESDDELLASPAPNIFTMKHARPASARPDKVSGRKPCKEFSKFAPLFNEVVGELASGKRKSVKFAKEQEISAGNFFILNGVMAYIAEVGAPQIRNGKKNARLRVIFDNGTEGENLLRSLATELYKDPNGRRISDPESGPLFGSEETTVKVDTKADRVTGCIYVVRSLSPLPEIKKLEGNLFKIGFTTGKFEDRIRNAKDDPTFLLAPVHPVRTYATVDMNTNKFENLLHRIFTEAKLDIEIKDRFGKPVKPREWFLLPLDVIEQAIVKIIDGSIIQYRYDARRLEIVKV